MLPLSKCVFPSGSPTRKRLLCKSLLAGDCHLLIASKRASYNSPRYGLDDFGWIVRGAPAGQSSGDDWGYVDLLDPRAGAYPRARRI